MSIARSLLPTGLAARALAALIEQSARRRSA
jgi:hypothetical protein